MLYVVRHGRTASNASGLLLGRADPELDELGLWQAERAGAYLSAPHGVELSRVISSPLLRTRQTASMIAAANGIDDVEYDDRFIELDYGEWDQMPIAEITPGQWRAWQADEDFAPPGGESLRELHDRVDGALGDIAQEARDSDIAIVSHVSPIKAIVAWALGAGVEVAWRMFVTPAAISAISTSSGRAQLHRFNDVAHLAEPPTPTSPTKG